MKKIVSLLLAGAMALSLAACGSNPAPAASQPAASAPAASQPAASTPSEPAMEPVELTIYLLPRQ